jgi:uncharacterized membrane-anchored protein
MPRAPREAVAPQAQRAAPYISAPSFPPEWTATRAATLKVPEIIALFWVAKLLTTALGESTSDFLVYQINPYIAVGLGGLGLAVALVLQLSVRRYIAWVYWLAVLMVAIFGTMAADVLHIVLKVPYLDSTIFFAGALVVIFGGWYLVERTLSIHSISTLRRELFYWAAVMVTFALGTAAGDMTAWTLRLGFLASAILFAVLIALPAIGYFLLGLNEIAAFWFAYILTRPLGASIADWLGKPVSASGLGWGDATVSAILFALVAIVVAYLAITRKDVQRPQPRPFRWSRPYDG